MSQSFFHFTFFVHSFSVKKNLEYSSSTEHRTKSETSASTVDSGCPSTSRSYSSQATIGSSFSRGAFSSHTVIDLTGSSGVNETELQSEDQNESDTLIDAVSHNATHLAGVMSSNLDGNIDVPEAEPKEETGQSSKKPTNKRKHESDGESSNKKAKTVDYKCERCDRSFSNETQLTRHMASRHWPCEVCCKEFETVQKRDEHKKTHKLEK